MDEPAPRVWIKLERIQRPDASGTAIAKNTIQNLHNERT
jgi:hypothetical protein